jgi:hypothetical protein
VNRVPAGTFAFLLATARGKLLSYRFVRLSFKCGHPDTASRADSRNYPDTNARDRSGGQLQLLAGRCSAGRFAPFVMIWLIDASANKLVADLYWMFYAVTGLLALYAVRAKLKIR